MIIYEKSIQNFLLDCQAPHHDLLITEIKFNMRQKMGRGVAPAEEESWRRTLVKIASLFEHLQNQDKQYVLLEFKVPLTQKRIDVILVGSDGLKRTLLIIELKGWSESFPSKVNNALKINARYGKAVSHPSREAEEYRNILTEQFSDINDYFPNLEAVSLLPNYELLKNDPIASSEFKNLISRIELYHKNNLDDFKKLLSSLFKDGISKQELNFLNKLEYKPSLNFQKHLESEFQNITLSTSQELAFNMIKKEIDWHLDRPQRKKLITISGLPGSGKTIVAFKILGYIYTNKKMTAKLQLPGPEFRDAVQKTFKNNDFNHMIGGAYSKGEQQLIIIDEAHKAYGHGNSQQFYKSLFTQSNFVITLIDDNQVINKKGFTKRQVIDEAQKNLFDVVEIDLKEQFRNGGDALYIDWLQKWIFDDDEENMQEEYVGKNYQFEVLKGDIFNAKYQKMYEDHNVRMGSFWTQPWSAILDELGKPVPKVKVDNKFYIWNVNKYWEDALDKDFPDLKHSHNFKKYLRQKIDINFNQNKKGLEYIAYFNTIQGSEFDYFFVHIPKLFYLNSNHKLDVDLSQLDMTDMKSQVWTKKFKPDPKKEKLNKLFFKNRLFVHLTRGIRGTYIYCEDTKLAAWIKRRLRRY